jgi:hypothetical protein
MDAVFRTNPEFIFLFFVQFFVKFPENLIFFPLAEKVEKERTLFLSSPMPHREKKKKKKKNVFFL